MINSVAVGMSGGVDSSVTAALLKEQGYNVIGITMQLHNVQQSDTGYCTGVDIRDASLAAERIGIPHYVVDFTCEFERFVIDYFVNEYKNGRTPNPCIACNKHIKFGSLLNRAKALGADFVATGHYARVTQKDGRFLLQRGVDKNKDQTYFLYTLSQQQLSRILMPLGDKTKAQTREIARRFGLVTAEKKESQEICFVLDNDYAAFIEKRAGISPFGDFIYNGQTVGTHKGIIHYTVGQRKGLGLALGKPIYITKIDAVTNKIHLGDDDQRRSTMLTAGELNFIPFDTIPKEFACTAKIRYNAKDSPCVVYSAQAGVRVVFENGQNAVTPGQSIVFYDGETVLGGGIIDA
ncbi:MAG: tRNA 2-thiouridine(34) synthase MnmA [Clostridiaceae bacterium]|nr:tRNA 2-thiouridine(34) synthase MnmA [Clostridiaceae bacterium]